jgi:hypothetical protein
MIPLILHHRIVDPFDITLTACAEEWQQNMNARLVYDFILLFVLFVLPLTLMTYCYIRISFSLWFIDSNVQTSISSSILNAARFSAISEDFPYEIRQNLTHRPQPIYMHYRKTNENCHSRQHLDDNRSFITSSRQRRNSILHDTNTYRQPSAIMLRRFSENDYRLQTNKIQLYSPGRAIPIRQRHSISQYTSGLLRSSSSSIQSQHRILNGNNHPRRSTIDFEHASRFLHSRRRVVKLLITLGNKNVFYINK